MAEDKKSRDAGAAGLPLGIAIGLGVGTALGVALDNIAMGVGMGIAIGVAIGLTMGAGARDKTKKDDSSAGVTSSRNEADGADGDGSGD